jgi:hypothetical protein
MKRTAKNTRSVQIIKPRPGVTKNEDDGSFPLVVAAASGVVS